MISVALVTAFWQRVDVSRAFVRHWEAVRDELARADVSLSLCAAHSQDDEYIRLIGASEWRTQFSENSPLASKFNAAVGLAPPDTDAVLVVGSDDFLDARYVLWAIERVGDGYELVGARDAYFWRRATNEAVHWRGYQGARENEPIGAGRVLSALLLDRLRWKPWPDHGERGLDGAMWARAQAVSAQTITSPLSEIGGMIVDVKDEENVTSWQKIVHAPGARRCDPSEIEDKVALPFDARIDEIEKPWFPGGGSVTVAMIARARNHEELDALERALFSARTAAREAVVVLDDSSTGHVEARLRELGCHVIARKWTHDFSAARNAIHDHVEDGQWLLVLDADEEIEPGNLLDIVRTTDADAITAEILIWTDEGRLRQPERVRMYRCGLARWERPTHNQLVGIESRAASTARVITSYAGTGEERALRQIPTLMQAVQADPEDTHAMMYLARALRILGQIEAAAFYAQRCVEIAPDDPATCSAWVELGAAQGQQGDFGAAFETFVQAARRHSGFPSIWQNLAALSLSAWAGSMRARSAYDGIPHNAPSDLEARISEAARMLHLPIGIEEGGDAVSG